MAEKILKLNPETGLLTQGDLESMWRDCVDAWDEDEDYEKSPIWEDWEGVEMPGKTLIQVEVKDEACHRIAHLAIANLGDGMFVARMSEIGQAGLENHAQDVPDKEDIERGKLYGWHPFIADPLRTTPIEVVQKAINAIVPEPPSQIDMGLEMPSTAPDA